MSQHDMDIAAASFAVARADLNRALRALASNSSGAAEPTTPYAYQFWADTTSGLLKIRNAANTGWVTIGGLASANLGLATRAGSASQAFSTAALTTAGLFDISGAAAGQIKFPATQNASSNPNTLDDYEEGTFTASLSCNGGGSINVIANTCRYTKIGRLVTVNGYIQVASVSLPSGSLFIAGLPFTPILDGGASIRAYGLAPTATPSIMASTTTGGSIIIEKFSAGSTADLAADVIGGSMFIFGATYPTT